MTQRQLRRQLRKELLRLKAAAYRAELRREVDAWRDWMADPVGGWLNEAGRGSGSWARWARRLAVMLRLAPLVAAWFRKPSGSPP